MKFHHFAIAVKDIKMYFEQYLQPVTEFNRLSRIYTIEDQAVRIGFVEDRYGAKIELVEPIGDKGPIQGFIDRKAGGLYHMAFLSVNLEEDIRKMKQQKFRLLSRSEGVAFLITPSFELFEIMDEHHEMIKRICFE